MLDNAPAIEEALAAILRQADSFRSLLNAGDRDGINARLAKARDWSGPAGNHR